jgi:hypothetical protein
MTGHPQSGIIVFDSNQESHVTQLVREFTRKFDDQSDFPGAGLIEDVIFQNSQKSRFIQLADFLASIALRLLKGKRSKDGFEIPPDLIDKVRTKIGGPIQE